MRNVVILIVLVVLLAACSQQGQGGTAVTTSPSDNTTPAADNAEPEVSAPRVEATPTPPLPMTWTPPAMVHGGHLFLLPVSGSSTRTVHIVEKGDTLAQLANRYNVPIEVLAGLNQIYDWDHIEIGTVLVIPVRSN